MFFFSFVLPTQIILSRFAALDSRISAKKLIIPGKPSYLWILCKFFPQKCRRRHCSLFQTDISDWHWCREARLSMTSEDTAAWFKILHNKCYSIRISDLKLGKSRCKNILSLWLRLARVSVPCCMATRKNKKKNETDKRKKTQHVLQNDEETILIHGSVARSRVRAHQTRT